MPDSKCASTDARPLMPLRLFPPPQYYCRLARTKAQVAVAPYDKRDKAVHRYTIIDNRGPLDLTVPLTKPHGIDRADWADCLVSTHDQWWRRHREALATAYGRTPFFEFLIDRFDPVFRSPEQWETWPSAVDLVRKANEIVCSILAIDAPAYTRATPPTMPADEPTAPYFQVRQHQFGFVDSLSVLDIIFNLGPEATLHLGLKP